MINCFIFVVILIFMLICCERAESRTIFRKEVTNVLQLSAHEKFSISRTTEILAGLSFITNRTILSSYSNIHQPLITYPEEPTAEPTADPSTVPTEAPTADPTTSPTAEPSFDPSVAPTDEPSLLPTAEPTDDPSESPTEAPSEMPSADPSFEPTWDPTTEPTASPTNPTAAPTFVPSVTPSATPTFAPSGPSYAPSDAPSPSPTMVPSAMPTRNPSPRPTRLPSATPTRIPTVVPTRIPTGPTQRPSTAAPSRDIVAVMFNSEVTFANIATSSLSASDAASVAKAAASSMSISSDAVTYSTQTSEPVPTNTARHNRRLQAQYIIVVTITTTAYLTGSTNPTALYATLTTRLTNAVSTATYLNYLRSFAGGSTFSTTTSGDITVVNEAVQLVGTPTAAPTGEPASNLPQRMATPLLIGTVLGAVFGSILLLFIIYQVILYRREERERVQARNIIEEVEKEVFLQHQIERGVSKSLEPVGKHDLQQNIECKMSESYRTGVIQIVVESDQM